MDSQCLDSKFTANAEAKLKHKFLLVISDESLKIKTQPRVGDLVQICNFFFSVLPLCQDVT